jgi:hypothetical protein
MVTRGYSVDHGLHTACIPTILIVVCNPSLFSTLFVFWQPLDPLPLFVLSLLYQPQSLNLRPQRSRPTGGSSRAKNFAVGRYPVTWYQAEGDDAPVRFCSCKLVSHTTVTDVYRKALLCRPVQLLRRLC